MELIPTQIPRDYESCQNRKYFLVLILRGGKKHSFSLSLSLLISNVFLTSVLGLAAQAQYNHMFIHNICLWRTLLKKKNKMEKMANIGHYMLLEVYSQSAYVVRYITKVLLYVRRSQVAVLD